MIEKESTGKTLKGAYNSRGIIVMNNWSIFGYHYEMQDSQLDNYKKPINLVRCL